MGRWGRPRYNGYGNQQLLRQELAMPPQKTQKLSFFVTNLRLELYIRYGFFLGVGEKSELGIYTQMARGRIIVVFH